MDIDLICNETPIKFSVSGDSTMGMVHMPDGTIHQFSIQRTEQNLLTIRTESQTLRAAVYSKKGTTSVSYKGRIYKFNSPEIVRLATTRLTTGTLVAPMTGVISTVSVVVGETVSAYQSLAVMEAMKVMATIEAPFDGVVASVNVTKGQQVGHGDTILVITPVTVQDGGKQN